MNPPISETASKFHMLMVSVRCTYDTLYEICCVSERKDDALVISVCFCCEFLLFFFIFFSSRITFDRRCCLPFLCLVAVLISSE